MKYKDIVKACCAKGGSFIDYGLRDCRTAGELVLPTLYFTSKETNIIYGFTNNLPLRLGFKPLHNFSQILHLQRFKERRRIYLGSFFHLYEKSTGYGKT